MTNAADITSPHAMSVECTDAFGRRRSLGVSVNDEGLLCLHTPPGEAAQLDWFQVDELRRQINQLRPRM